MLLNAVAALFVLWWPSWTLRGVAPQSLLLAVIYCIGMYALYRSVVHSTRIAAQEMQTGHRTRLWPALLRFLLAAGALLLLGRPFANPPHRSPSSVVGD